MVSSVLPKLPHCTEPSEVVVDTNPAFLCVEMVRDQPSRPLRGIFFGIVLSTGVWAGIGLCVMLARR